MDNSPKRDAFVQNLDVLTLALITLIPGLVIHSCIIVINVNDWWKGRSLTLVDHIVTSLGISRMWVQWAPTLHFLVVTFSPKSLNSYVIVIIIEAVYTFFLYVNIWLTALLSIVFCLKISNLHNRLFLYLKEIIANRTVHFIVVSGLLSAFSCLMHLWTTVVRNDGSYNTTMDNQILDCIYIESIINLTVGASIPLFFYLISFILLFTSLYHHIMKMKMNSNLSINLETYYSAMKLVSFTFIYNTLYFTGHVVVCLLLFFYCVTLQWPYIVLEFLPVLHSSYLIYRTAKLRRQMSKVLQNVIDFIFQRKATATRENAEAIVL
ncbi:taste receptor type 2 member 64-like [Phyllobates terribilis]|uniref:taste receptor type 2 member 64-like n=1 Tax=Phyllobates terribilis TaxID=111132 RepID=UPI003CCB546B